LQKQLLEYKPLVMFSNMNMIKKGQVKRLNRSDAIGQAMFIESLFGIVA
jgi:hypothetical protein